MVAVIEFQKVVAQVVRAKGEVSRGVVQNPGRPLGLGQIPGGLRAEIRPLLRFVLGDVTLCGEPRRELLRDRAPPPA